MEMPLSRPADSTPRKTEIRDESMGPAMRRLTDLQRKFVIALLDNGGKNYKLAALEAGYSRQSHTASQAGYLAAHNPKVQEALLEVSKQRIRTSGVMAVSYLIECLSNDGLSAKDRMKAATMLMDRQGLHAFSEHKTTVEHTMDEGDMVAKIQRLSEKLGIDPQKLLGSNSPRALEVIDITPEPVASSEGLEDIL